MSTVNILLGFICLFLGLIVYLGVKLVSTSDDLHLEKASHRITMHHLENERSKKIMSEPALKGEAVSAEPHNPNPSPNPIQGDAEK